MSSLNVSVLAAARETYTEQLKNYLSPLIFEGFVSLYDDAVSRENEKPEFNYNYLKRFQMLLKDIPFWNQSILEEETRRILNRINFLMKLVAAIFVSYVKILASVRLGGDGNNIKVRIPTSDIFIHTIYTKAAEIIYYNPHKFANYHLRENRDYILTMIYKSIDDAINGMIPLENILNEYLSNVYSGQVKNTEKELEDLETVEEKPFSSELNGKEMGLFDSDSVTSGNGSVGFNENFKAGEEAGNIAIGNDDFKDNEIIDDEYSVGTNPASIDDPFKTDAPVSSSMDDPFKTDAPVSSSMDDPFKTDTAATESVDMDDDPFKTATMATTSDDPFSNNAPIPPDLGNDKIFADNKSFDFVKDLL
jgi:hypothetical protein